MVQLKIQKAVPIPQEAYLPKKTTYPFAIMEVKDSFFTDKPLASVKQAISHFKTKDKSREFVTLEVDETGEENGKRIGVRCWRIK